MLEIGISSLLCFSHIMTHLPTIGSTSGHFLFQFGKYQECLDTPSFNYNLVGLGN